MQYIRDIHRVAKYIPYTGNFSRHVYFTVKHGTRIFAVENSRMKVIQKFSRFSHHATKNICYYLNEINKAPCQIVYHMYSRRNPRPPCGKSCIITVMPVGHQSGLKDTTMPQY